MLLVQGKPKAVRKEVQATPTLKEVPVVETMVMTIDPCGARISGVARSCEHDYF